MRRLIVTLDDDISPLLAKKRNQSRIVNEALRLYLSDITTGAMDDVARGFKITSKYLKEINSKLDYLTKSGYYEVGKRSQVMNVISEPTVVMDSQDPADAPRDLGELVAELKLKESHEQQT